MKDIRSFFAPIKLLHETIRTRVVEECERSSLEQLSAIVGDDKGDTIFAVDRVSEAILIEFFKQEIASKVPIVLIAEGIENGRTRTLSYRPDRKNKGKSGMDLPKPSEIVVIPR